MCVRAFRAAVGAFVAHVRQRLLRLVGAAGAVDIRGVPLTQITKTQLCAAKLKSMLSVDAHCVLSPQGRVELLFNVS